MDPSCRNSSLRLESYSYHIDWCLPIAGRWSCGLPWQCSVALVASHHQRSPLSLFDSWSCRESWWLVIPLRLITLLKRSQKKKTTKSSSLSNPLLNYGLYQLVHLTRYILLVVDTKFKHQKAKNILFLFGYGLRTFFQLHVILEYTLNPTPGLF